MLEARRQVRYFSPEMTKKKLSSLQNAGPKRAECNQGFTRIFRWNLPRGATPPGKVEVAGTFNDWKRVPLCRDVSGGWQVALKHISSRRTHHYMLLADGKPVHDENCDGLAVPQGAQEEQFAIATPRGPRVFMLFAQAM